MRPWRMVGATRRTRVADLFLQHLSEWSREWTAHAAPTARACVPAEEFASRGLDGANCTMFTHGQFQLVLQIVPESLVGLVSRGFTPTAMEERLGGMDRHSDIWADVTRDALADLGQRLLPPGSGAAQCVSLAPPAAWWLRASGALACTATVGPCTVHAVLGDALVQRLGGPPTVPAQLRALADPRLGVLDKPVDMSIWMGHFEISVGALASLAPGDVVTLNLTLDERFAVHVQGKPTQVRAHPGRRGERVAVQLGAARP